jgi:hypothetical protein
VKKLSGHLSYFCSSCVPRCWWQRRLSDELAKISDYGRDEVMTRVDYYNKLERPFSLDLGSKNYRQFSLEGFWPVRKLARWLAKGTKPRRKPAAGAYYRDFKPYLRFFPAHLRFDCWFGDKKITADQPAFVKSRPLLGDNSNSVLVKVDAARHFAFVDDPIPFAQKLDVAVYRGPCHQKHRQLFIRQCHGLPRTDIGDTREAARDNTWHRPYMSIADQLRHKFIISVEGNDVATNLKWIMASNSLCMMTPPKHESWFMEGQLVPGRHYVALAEDYSDLPAKIDYYLDHPAEAECIIAAARAHAAQFRDPEKERLISFLVIVKYLSLANPGREIPGYPA